MKNKLLIGTGILFILSLFTGSPSILTICLTLFIITVVVNCCDMWKEQNIIEYIFNKTESDSIERFKNKQYCRAIINVIVASMVVIGIVMVVLSVVCMYISAMN